MKWLSIIICRMNIPKTSISATKWYATDIASIFLLTRFLLLLLSPALIARFVLRLLRNSGSCLLASATGFSIEKGIYLQPETFACNFAILL